MAKQLQIRRGKTDEIDNFIGAEGELTYDTESKEVKVHDGVTKGGINVSAPVTLTPATPLKAGVIQLATQTEVSTGINATKAVTPSTMKEGVGAALGVKKGAPVFGARAWGVVQNNVLVGKGNASVSVQQGTHWTITFPTPMPNNNYLISIHGDAFQAVRAIMQVNGKKPDSYTFSFTPLTTGDILSIRDFHFMVYAEE